MAALPNTRQSLIIRLKDPGDERAWQEFLEIYEPVVYRLGRRNGLQHTDAVDLCQEVLSIISRRIGAYDADPAAGRFRGWLYRIARNVIFDALRERRKGVGIGGSSVQEMFAQVEDEGEGGSDEFDMEYRREAFQRAAAKVRPEVEGKTWQAFWLTAVEGRTIEEVASELEMKVGSVYAARSRILARLRREVEILAGGEETE